MSLCGSVHRPKPSTRLHTLVLNALRSLFTLLLMVTQVLGSAVESGRVAPGHRTA